MTVSRYVLRVYTPAGYHPDLGLQSISRARVERRARRLRHAGFDTRLVTITPSCRALRVPPRRRELA